MNNSSPATPSVLIAEDDSEIRQALERILRFEGYATSAVNDGAAALEAIADQQPDVIVLDVMMPFVDGLVVCRRLRERGDRTPVLMLTARHELSDRIEGLDAGADDYLVKPFEFEELLARLRALLRRVADPDDVVLAVGPISPDVRRRIVPVDSTEIDERTVVRQILDHAIENLAFGQRRECRFAHQLAFGLE